MDYSELYKKYLFLLDENNKLKSEILKLKTQINIPDQHKDIFSINNTKNFLDQITSQDNSTEEDFKTINKISGNKDKIELFMSVFRGREDIYSKRWQNKSGKSGYSPVCSNQWKQGICFKPKVKCSLCSNKIYEPLDKIVIEDHLRGNSVIGIYPMLQDETCYFLAIDFDEQGWKRDISVIREVCKGFEIPVAIERSRSGNGAHAWVFFEDKIEAVLARKLGTALLTYSMNKRHEITFKSYDRLFPNQDTMPKGGIGNLIALPLQLEARENNNSVFIDDNFKAFDDQWEFLSSIKKLKENKIEDLISNLCSGNELGALKIYDEDTQKPWTKNKAKLIKLAKDDFPKNVKLIKADMLYILKDGFSQIALNALKRLSAFKNPDYYKAQAMRLPTFNKPRIISCSDELEEYLCFPRGCEEDIICLINKFKINIELRDETNHGRNINVEFNGILREEQLDAVSELLKYNNGVLSAATAFGKTVIAAKLIAERKVNTLILVHRQQLLSQWINRLSEFLVINEELPVLKKTRGRKKKQSVIGFLGAGKNNLSGIIDVAIMQSLINSGEVKEYVKNYGMVIVDECHHVPAFSFEQILKKVNAKFVYGLTATPIRLDGHQPIIFFHCGPVRFRVDTKKQIEKMPFEHFVIPRFTNLRILSDYTDRELSIQDIYTEITTNDLRNELIVSDVVACYESGRNSLVLTERTAHVELLTKKLRERIPDVISLIGGMGTK